MPTLPYAIARFAAGVAACPEDIPPAVAALCPNLMLNAAAAALAAAAHPDAVALAGIARALGGNGRSTVIGMGQRTSPVYAALVNGTLIRLLDFDDHIPDREDARPTAAVLPAVLALGEMHGSPGASALAAFAAGAEIVARLCLADAYGDGSAARALAASASPIGAAVASSMLLGLDAAGIAHAVALAAGAPDGDAPEPGAPDTGVFPDLNAVCRSAIPTAGPTAPALVGGRAAMHGVMAALQAQAGITAAGADDRDEGDERRGGILYRLGESWHLTDPGVAIRLYPCHPAAHAIIDAALGLAQLHRLAPDDIAAVHIGLTRYTLEQRMPRILPADGWEARACAAFIAAATLCHGAPLINFFSDAAVRDPGVRALMERVSVEASLRPSLLSPHPAEVAVTLHDGRTLRHRVDHPRGSPALPPDDAELDAKFLYCTRYILPADHIDEAVTGFRSIAANPNITGIVSVLGG